MPLNQKAYRDDISKKALLSLENEIKILKNSFMSERTWSGRRKIKDLIRIAEQQQFRIQTNLQKGIR